jgi:hypothetical protein
MPNQVDEYNDYRSRMNEKLLGADNKVKKIANLSVPIRKTVDLAKTCL